MQNDSATIDHKSQEPNKLALVPPGPLAGLGAPSAYWTKCPAGLARIIAADNLKAGVLLALMELSRSRTGQWMRVSATGIAEHLGCPGNVSRVRVHLRDYIADRVLVPREAESRRHSGRFWYVAGIDFAVPSEESLAEAKKGRRLARQLTRGDSAPGDQSDSAPGDQSDSAPGDQSDSAHLAVSAKCALRDSAPGDQSDSAPGDQSTGEEEKRRPDPAPDLEMAGRTIRAWQSPAVSAQLVGEPYSEHQIRKAIGRTVANAAGRFEWSTDDACAYLERLALDPFFLEDKRSPLYVAQSGESIRLRGSPHEYIPAPDGSPPAVPEHRGATPEQLREREREHEARKQSTPELSALTSELGNGPTCAPSETKRAPSRAPASSFDALSNPRVLEWIDQGMEGPCPI